MTIQLFLLLVLTIQFINAGQRIPPHIQQKLQEGGTFGELMKKSSIVLNDDEPVFRARVLSASLMEARPRNKQQPDRRASDVSLLKTIKQGTDTCYLQKICQRVPLDDSDPQVLLFPRCSEVTRCVGSCCDSRRSCKPTKKEYVYQTVFRLRYIGNNRFAIDKKMNIPMEQHLGCECQQCEHWELVNCGLNQVIGPDCNCICRNEVEKASCHGLRQWSEESCSCECLPMSCQPGSVLDKGTCSCVEQSTQQNHSS